MFDVCQVGKLKAAGQARSSETSFHNYAKERSEYIRFTPRDGCGPVCAASSEYMFNAFPSALEYFAGSLHGANSDILACAHRAFAQVSGRINRMKRH